MKGAARRREAPNGTQTKHLRACQARREAKGTARRREAPNGSQRKHLRACQARAYRGRKP
eukprot:2073118-Pyramimonas_sp.AAC.1